MLNIQSSLSGDYIKHLMRKHQVTIRDLASRMNISISRVKYVREYGVSGNAYVRDWMEAIEK